MDKDKENPWGKLALGEEASLSDCIVAMGEGQRSLLTSLEEARSDVHTIQTFFMEDLFLG